MPTIQICVLANSIKNSHRCIAGLEVEKTTDGKRNVGGWIRPVSRHDEGALNLEERALRSWWRKNEPQLLDVIEVHLDKNESDRSQPENWLIAPSKPWKLIEKMAWKDLLPFVDRPKDIWLESPRDWEKFSPSWLRRQARVQSLYLIKPETIYLEAQTEYDSAEARNKKSRWVVFTYNRFTYRLPLTDPVIEEKYLGQFPTIKDGLKKFQLASGNDCLLSLSYTPAFRTGYHYKVVSAILEPGK